MFWTFNLRFDILATVWATFPNIGQIFVQFSGHSDRHLADGVDGEDLSFGRLGFAAIVKNQISDRVLLEKRSSRSETEKNIVLFIKRGSLSKQRLLQLAWAGNTKEGSITVPLTSCLTGLE